MAKQTINWQRMQKLMIAAIIVMILVTTLSIIFWYFVYFRPIKEGEEFQRKLEQQIYRHLEERYYQLKQLQEEQERSGE